MAQPDRGPTGPRYEREGMFVGFPLKSYPLLVDYTGRVFRDGKAGISPALAGIFDRGSGTP